MPKQNNRSSQLFGVGRLLQHGNTFTKLDSNLLCSNAVPGQQQNRRVHWNLLEQLSNRRSTQVEVANYKIRTYHLKQLARFRESRRWHDSVCKLS